MALFSWKVRMPTADEALPGRDMQMPVARRHFVLDAPIAPPYPAGMEIALFGMGCFWGAERKFWEAAGVFTTAVGYAGGFTPNPTYEEVCTGRTGHNEVVWVVFDPKKTSYEALLKVFWESHDPTQGMRQGNDVGTQYRSAVFYHGDKQKQAALAFKAKVERSKAWKAPVVTEISEAKKFWPAEDYHQKYLVKNPDGYDNHYLRKISFDSGK